jgi:hypothetical protein
LIAWISVSVRVDDLVKDLRPPEAAALRAVLDKIINTNNWQPSDQGRQPISVNGVICAGLDPAGRATLNRCG